MKTFSEYQSMPYRLEIVKDPYEGGYVAQYPDLPGCITTAETIEEAVKMAEDAKREWLMAAIDDGISIKEPMPENYSGQFKLRIPKTLHKALAETARKEGISMNQYCVYLLSRYSSN